jgi:hypothetical protein
LCHPLFYAGLVNGNFSVPFATIAKSDLLTIVVRVNLVGEDGKEIALLPLGFTYMPDENEWYLEPAPATLDYGKIAKDWVHDSLPTLQLLKWEAKLNEGSVKVEFVGTAWDDHQRPHSFHVNMTKDGKVLYSESSVT